MLGDRLVELATAVLSADGALAVLTEAEVGMRLRLRRPRVRAA